MLQVSPIVQHVVVHNGFACELRAPIAGHDHLVVQDTMDFPAPVKDGITSMRPSPARTATAQHACAHVRRRVLNMHARLQLDMRATCMRACSSTCTHVCLRMPLLRDMRACVHRHTRMRACD